jgi:hypothetical protein
MTTDYEGQQAPRPTRSWAERHIALQERELDWSEEPRSTSSWSDVDWTATADPELFPSEPSPDVPWLQPSKLLAPTFLHSWEFAPWQRLLLRLVGFEVRSECLWFRGKRLALDDQSATDSKD